MLIADARADREAQSKSMDFLNDLPLPAALALLALVDGLSIGTLLIPLFFLIAPGRPRIVRILTYLSTIAIFYFLVGALFTLGLVNMIAPAQIFLSSAVGQSVLLCIGIVLFVIGVAMPTKSSRERRAQRAEAVMGGGSGSAPQPTTTPTSSGRLLRWRTTLLDPGTTQLAIMAVAVAAGLAELAGMLPYLLGMTMLADAPLSMPVRFAGLAAYCFVMITPALALLVCRLVAAHRVDTPLQRFANWLEQTGSDTTAWVLAIIGFLLTRSAAAELGITPFGS